MLHVTAVAMAPSRTSVATRNAPLAVADPSKQSAM